MTNAILVLTVVVGLIGAAAAYKREGDFQPHHEGGGDRDGPHRFGPQGGPGGSHFGPPGPPFGGDHGKMMRMKVLMGIHETICFGLPTPNFTRPDNNNNNQRFGPHRTRAVQHMMSAAVMPHQSPIFGVGPADEPINVNPNITDDVRKEEATLVRAVARQAASLMTCGGATDDNCAALTAAEQRLIDFRRNHSISCEFEGHNNGDNHESQFGRPPMPVPPQAPVQPQPARLPVNNGGSGSSFSNQQQQPLLNRQPQPQFAQQQQQQQQQQSRPGNFNANNNFQPPQPHNNNNMLFGRK